MRYRIRPFRYLFAAMALVLAINALVPAASAAPPLPRPVPPWVKLCLRLKRMPQHRNIRCHFPPPPRVPAGVPV